MTKDEILLKLHAMVQPETGMSETREDQPGLNAQGEKMSQIKKVAEDIEKNHLLAKELWNTKNHAAQLLSFFTEQPEKVTEKQLDDQILTMTSPELIDAYCRSVVFESPYLNAKLEEWCLHESSLIKRAGYVLVKLKAAKGRDFTDGDFMTFLGRIHDEIGNESDMVKEAMYYALIAIGRRSRFLNSRALQIAEEVGELYLRKPARKKLPDAWVVLDRDNMFTVIQ